MTDDATAPVEKVSQEQMLAQFQERFNNTVKENEELARKIKENEVIALKLQGAIEALQYYQDTPAEEPPRPEEEVADNLATAE
tara:strand:- start:23 stop:271 length:249 start_codon:yes stop_codon:yes gene_type:complete